MSKFEELYKKAGPLPISAMASGEPVKQVLYYVLKAGDSYLTSDNVHDEMFVRPKVQAMPFLTREEADETRALFDNELVRIVRIVKKYGKTVDDLTIEQLRDVVWKLKNSLTVQSCNGSDLVNSMSIELTNLGISLDPETEIQ